MPAAKYKLLDSISEYIGQVGDRSFATMILPDGLLGRHLCVVLTSIPDRDYLHFVMGGFDSELNARVVSLREKAIPYPQIAEWGSGR